MKRIALKIDVDTYRGTLTGVPALSALLKSRDASASFFFSLGFDHGGRESRAASLRDYYGLTTRLYGRWLPSPNIGARCADTLREVGDAGFEVGLRAWNRVDWERKIGRADNVWVEAQLKKARTRFTQIFGQSPSAHAAPGWRMNRHALRLTQRLGFAYASDCRGDHPFIPVINGEIVACPQLPTTLPTLDEVLALQPGSSPDQAADRILQLSSAIAGDHVFTLRAELEGMKLSAALERLIDGWQSNNYQLVPLRDLHSTLDVSALPRHAVEFAEAPGRVGLRLTQGSLFP